MNEEEVNKLLSDIKQFRDDFKEKGNSYYERLSNKDILFYFLNKMEEINTRVTKVESKQKMIVWIIPIIITIFALMTRI